jgi:hypothetical protein
VSPRQERTTRRNRSRNQTRVIRDDIYRNVKITSECTQNLLNSNGLSIPGYRMVSPNWPLRKMFLLTQDLDEPPPRDCKF